MIAENVMLFMVFDSISDNIYIISRVRGAVNPFLCGLGAVCVDTGRRGCYNRKYNE